MSSERDCCADDYLQYLCTLLTTEDAPRFRIQSWSVGLIVGRSDPASNQKEKDEIFVNQIRLTLFLALSAAAFGQNNVTARWRQIVGVITAPGVDNPVAVTTDGGTTTAQIHSGTAPWTTRGGSARVNLSTGEGSFDVEGLVLNGGNASGTPGPVKAVVGTLVCNPGAANQSILDTAAVDLGATGNAELSFKLNVPVDCANPLFLIRTPAPGLRWIATGAQRAMINSSIF